MSILNNHPPPLPLLLVSMLFTVHNIVFLQMLTIDTVVVVVFLCKLTCVCFCLYFSILVNMDDRMIEQFVDEDDFIINLDFDNQLGHFELTLQY